MVKMVTWRSADFSYWDGKGWTESTATNTKFVGSAYSAEYPTTHFPFKGLSPNSQLQLGKHGDLGTAEGNWDFKSVEGKQALDIDWSCTLYLPVWFGSYAGHIVDMCVTLEVGSSEGVLPADFTFEVAPFKMLQDGWVSQLFPGTFQDTNLASAFVYIMGKVANYTQQMAIRVSTKFHCPYWEPQKQQSLDFSVNFTIKAASIAGAPLPLTSKDALKHCLIEAMGDNFKPFKEDDEWSLCSIDE